MTGHPLSALHGQYSSTRLPRYLEAIIDARLWLDFVLPYRCVVRPVSGIIPGRCFPVPDYAARPQTRYPQDTEGRLHSPRWRGSCRAPSHPGKWRLNSRRPSCCRSNLDENQILIGRILTYRKLIYFQIKLWFKFFDAGEVVLHIFL